MATFELALQHLGPSAAPIMGFLHNKTAAALLVTNKYVGGLVQAHARRWGFALAPYSETPDGSFTMRAAGRHVQRAPLKPWQGLRFRKLAKSPWWPVTSTAAVYIGGSWGAERLILHGTKEEIRTIAREAAPYMAARTQRLAQEEAARKVAEALAAEKAKKDAYIATYTIKASGPPTYPWGKPQAN